jgi:hypothetical protein
VIIGAGVAVAGVGLGGWVFSSARNREQQLGPVFAAAQPGQRVGPCTIVAVHPLNHGGVPVVLETSSGRRYQVDVLARDPSGPDGVATTPRLSLFVSNGGDGRTDTDEEQGLGAMALAELLRAGDQHGTQLPALLTLEQRIREHSGRSFGVPLTS